MFNRKKEKDKQEFYYCTVCKNLMIKLNDSGLTPSCCSKTMIILDEGEIEGTVEKHKPVCEYDGCKIKIKVGSEPHPMDEDHYIQWIFVKTDKGIHGQFLCPDDKATTCFEIGKDEKVEGVYSYCNVHGLWSADKECNFSDKGKHDCH